MRRVRAWPLVVFPLAVAHAQNPAPVTASDGWARPCRVGTTCGLYLTLENRSALPMQVTAITSPLAARVELHETMLHNGQAHMMTHGATTIAPHSRLEGKPGKWHVMLIGVRRPLAVGDTVALTIRVQRADGRAPATSLAARAIVRAP